MVSPADAERLRLAQVGIRTLVERDLAAFFASLDLGRPEAARDALLEFVPYLVSTYGESAAAVAADWYDEQRAVERVPGRYRAVMQDSPYTDAVEGTVRRAAGALWTPTPGDALLTLSSKAGKYALAAGRQTIVTSTDRDPRASGWQRVTRGGACRFCRLLAGRGAVYKQSTVHFASHGSCNCAAAPSWDPDAPEVDVGAYEASKRTSRMGPEQRARHNATIRVYLDTI
ncbi:hypothetical protein MF406_14230 [Georgenia sp. TF02-10]|uniref:VG15 protein n=1 Tax=Georgenia sp. TF02-10 TaxID=2917725 RepID=UPI001FA708B0|nr:hypothetical protein [Georgenia sp. TF02-10]UNX54090.1 hypothetical protein MF406_14230 [Georgenia sp. TF02-10]